MLEDERRRDAIRAAKLYYLDDHNQSWIAGELGVSRATRHLHFDFSIPSLHSMLF